MASAARMARRLLPAAIVVPLLAGALTVHYERRATLRLRSGGGGIRAAERDRVRGLRAGSTPRAANAPTGCAAGPSARCGSPRNATSSIVETALDGIITIDRQGTDHRLEHSGGEDVRLAARRGTGPRARRADHSRARIAKQHRHGMRRYIETGVGARAQQAHRDGGAASRGPRVSRSSWRSRRSASARSWCSAAFIRDITGRARAEAALRESEQRFRTTANAAPVLIWMSGPDKRCTWFNQRWLDFVGRAIEQELGDGWCDNLHPADFDRALDTYHAAFDARRPYEMEYRLQRDDGAWRWLLERGTPHHRPERRVRGLHRHLHRHHRASRDRRAAAREPRALQDAGRIAAADDLDLPARRLHRLPEPAMARLHRPQRGAAARQGLAGAGASRRSRQGADANGRASSAAATPST